jgi:hypothetical protein
VSSFSFPGELLQAKQKQIRIILRQDLKGEVDSGKLIKKEPRISWGKSGTQTIKPSTVN